MATREDFDGKAYRPPPGSRHYVFAFVPAPALSRDAACAVRIESEAYLAATGTFCQDHLIGETLTNLPTYMREVEPGLFTSTADRTFTELLLGGLGMRLSDELAAAAAPWRGARPAGPNPFVDPVDRYMDPYLRNARDENVRRPDPIPEIETGPEPSRDPGDYLFCAMPDPDTEGEAVPMVLVHVVSKAFFERHGCMEYEGVALAGMPSHMEELAEAQYQSPEPIGVVRMELEAMGMSFSPDLDAHVRASMEDASPRPGW